jgi:hypothetical protein
MQSTQHNPNEAAYRATIDQMRECAAGKRGWVSITHAVAARCGVSLGSLRVMATGLGLRVSRGGRHGWTCHR